VPILVVGHRWLIDFEGRFLIRNLDRPGVLFRIGIFTFIGRDIDVVVLEPGNMSFDGCSILGIQVDIARVGELDQVLLLEVLGEAPVSSRLMLSVRIALYQLANEATKGC